MSGLHKNISNARLIATELKGAVNLGDLIKTDGGWFFFIGWRLGNQMELCLWKHQWENCTVPKKQHSSFNSKILCKWGCQVTDIPSLWNKLWTFCLREICLRQWPTPNISYENLFHRDSFPVLTLTNKLSTQYLTAFKYTTYTAKSLVFTFQGQCKLQCWCYFNVICHWNCTANVLCNMVTVLNLSVLFKLTKTGVNQNHISMY